MRGLRRRRKTRSSPSPGLSNTRARRRSRNSRSERCAPNVIFCGRSSTPCISHTFRRAGRLPVHSIRKRKARGNERAGTQSCAAARAWMPLEHRRGPEDLLLIPEGALRLKGQARTIVELCDGERTLAEIVVELQRHYPSAQPARIETEALALLARLRDRGVLEYA